jgi:hypothetical protein
MIMPSRLPISIEKQVKLAGPQLWPGITTEYGSLARNLRAAKHLGK